MRRIPGRLLLVVLALGTPLLAAGPASAGTQRVTDSCSAGTPQPVQGGYAVTDTCTGPSGYYTVSGAGSTQGDAAAEAGVLADLAATRGIKCTFGNSQAVPGGYRSASTCFYPGNYQGFSGAGNNLTDASAEARRLVVIAADRAQTCTTASTNSAPSGITVSLSCVSRAGNYPANGTGFSMTYAASDARQHIH